MKKLATLLVLFVLALVTAQVYHPPVFEQSSVRMTTTNDVLILSGILALPLTTISASTNSTFGLGAGLVCWDTNYLYISVGTNAWKRTTLTNGW